METKFFEVRANATCIPIVASRLKATNESEKWMLAHTGYGLTIEEQSQFILVTRLECDSPAVSTPHRESSPEMCIIHKYLMEHFDELTSGAVLDSDFIEGRRLTPRKTDRLWMEDD